MKLSLAFPLALLVSATVTTLSTSAQDAESFRVPRPRDARVPMSAPADAPPRLGVMVAEEDDGVLVSEVLEDSLAEDAGMEAGDILFKINGRRVEVIGDIPAILSETSAPGSEVRFTVIRSGEGLVSLSGTRAAPRRPEADAPNVWFSEEGEAGGFLGIGLGESADGALVSSVFPGTTAWFAGLKEGDVITSLAGDPVESGQDLADRVGSLKAGRMINLQWTRDGKEMKTRIRLGHRVPEGGPLGMVLDGSEPLFFGRAAPGAAPPMPPRRLPMGPRGHGRLQGPGGQVFVLPEDVDVDVEHMHEWAERLHEQMRGAHDGHHDEAHELEFKVQGDGDGEMRIRIENGKVFIDKDGKAQVIELGGGAEGTAFRVSSPGDVLVVPAVQNPAVQNPAGQAAMGVPASPACEASGPCEAECEPSAACDDSPACDADTECGEVPADAPVVESSDDLT